MHHSKIRSNAALVALIASMGMSFQAGAQFPAYRAGVGSGFVPQPTQQQPQTVGIRTDQMNFYAASQMKPQWCWAATIQMILNYYGISISQEEIVLRTKGGLPNHPGSVWEMTANLNNFNVDASGRPYLVRARFLPGSPPPALLVDELRQKRPVIIGYRGHAVVVTAANFSASPVGPIVHSIAVRDPFPTDKNMASKGRQVFDAANLANMINGTWIIRVNKQ